MLRFLKNPTGALETLAIDVSPSQNIIVVSCEKFVAVWNYESLKYEGYYKSPTSCFGIVKIIDPLPIVAVSQTGLEVELFFIQKKWSYMAYPKLGTLKIEMKRAGDYISAISYHHSKKTNEIHLFVGTGKGYVCVLNISDYFTRNHLFKYLLEEKPLLNHPL